LYLGKLDSSAPSGEIDKQVKSLLQEAVPFTASTSKKFKELQPDLFLPRPMRSLRRQSARSGARGEADAGKTATNRSLSPNRLADIWMTSRVAEVLEPRRTRSRILRSLKNRVVAIIEKTCILKNRPTVACIEMD